MALARERDPRLCCLYNSDAVSQKPCNFRLHSFINERYDARHPGLEEFHPNPIFLPGRPLTFSQRPFDLELAKP
jgi:hypothetical protein